MIIPPPPQEFDPAESLIKTVIYNTGYHTKFRPPATAHPTRESADYAIRCLASADPADRERGRKVLDRILSLQVTDPTAAHFGIWGWFAEEPPEEMAPADWNWADFIGVRLLEIIHDYADRLTPDLLARTRDTIDRAAWSIFRRNVGPSYTNICAMGAVVCIAWGETLPEPRLLDYGARRLRNMRCALEFNEGYPEYNSPNYGLVVLEELERLLHFAKHPQARADAEAILNRTWQLIADQFHPGTRQWAGPQSRAYQDWLSPHQAHFLGTRLGQPISVRTPGSFDASPVVFGPEGVIKPYPCPESIRPRFAHLPASPHQHRQTWVKHPDGTPAQISTTWFTHDATLGSMNRETTWIQRRTILGFWRTPEDFATRFRLRLLRNEGDFASGFTWNHQEGPRVLTGFHFLTDNGDHHPYFYHPPGGTFTTGDLRIRYEIGGKGAAVSEISPGVFELRAGTHKVIVHTGPLRFDGKLISNWVPGALGELAWVEGIFYSGPERPFNPRQVGETTAAAAIELLRADETPSSHPITETVKDGHRHFAWRADQPYAVAVPTAAIKVPTP